MKIAKILERQFYRNLTFLKHAVMCFKYDKSWNRYAIASFKMFKMLFLRNLYRLATTIGT